MRVELADVWVQCISVLWRRRCRPACRCSLGGQILGLAPVRTDVVGRRVGVHQRAVVVQLADVDATDGRFPDFEVVAGRSSKVALPDVEVFAAQVAVLAVFQAAYSPLSRLGPTLAFPRKVVCSSLRRAWRALIEVAELGVDVEIAHREGIEAAFLSPMSRSLFARQLEGAAFAGEPFIEAAQLGVDLAVSGSFDAGMQAFAR